MQWNITHRNKILPSAATLMESIMLSEINQTKTCYMIPLICGIKKIIQMNVYTKLETDSDIENKVTKGEREVGRDKLGVWD